MRVSTLSSSAVVLLVAGQAAAFWPFTTPHSFSDDESRPVLEHGRSFAPRGILADAGGKHMAKREWYCYWFGENCPSEEAAAASAAVPVVSTESASEIKPEEWTQVDLATGNSASSSTTDPWAGFTQFNWNTWKGWGFWGHTLDYVKAWYYDNYGLHLPAGVQDWAHLSGIVSFYGTPPAKQTATPSINVYTHGGALPFASPTSSTHSTTSLHSTATPAPSPSPSVHPMPSGKSSTTRKPTADEEAFNAASAKGASTPAVSAAHDYTSLAPHASMSAQKVVNAEEAAFYAMSKAAAAVLAGTSSAATATGTGSTGTATSSPTTAPAVHKYVAGTWDEIIAYDMAHNHGAARKARRDGQQL